MPPIHWDTIITGLVSTALLWGVHKLTDTFKNYQSDSAKWRKSVDDRLNMQDEKIMSMLKSQVTQMRSDVIHRTHRYLDDLGMASTEEKDAFWAEYREYCELCEQYGIENNFVDELARRVMALPEREI